MSDAGLYTLYKLHLIDSALHDMKMHAAALDVGQAELAEAKLREESSASLIAEAKALSSELRDKELEQKSLEDKRKKYEKQLFDGSLHFARDVENVQKEIAMLNDLLGKVDGRIMELWEALPPVQAEADAAKRVIEDLRSKAAEKRSAAEQEHQTLQAKYRAKAAERASAVGAVEPGLLRQYEAVKKATGSTAMATVTGKDACSHCGMHVPERGKALIRQGRPTPCESCKRLLFIVMPEA